MERHTKRLFYDSYKKIQITILKYFLKYFNYSEVFSEEEKSWNKSLFRQRLASASDSEYVLCHIVCVLLFGSCHLHLLFQIERWHFLPFNPISENSFSQQCGGSRCAGHYMEWMNTWIGQRPQMGSNPPTTCGAKFFRKQQILYQKSIYGNIWTTKIEPGPENDIRKYFANIVITKVGRNLSHLWSRLASLPFPIRHLWIRVFLAVAKNLVIFSKYQQNDLFNDNQAGWSVQW